MSTTPSPSRPVISNIKSAAHGRWREILISVAGIPGDSLTTGHKPCPKCGGTDRFRAFDDLEKSGGVYCNQCFRTKNGDGLATIQWFTGRNFLDTLRAVADYLGPAACEPITVARSGKPDKGSNGAAGSLTHATDIVEEIAKLKRMPLESFKAFGAHSAKRGKMTVARTPMFSELREQCSHFDMATLSPEFQKGFSAKGKAVGLFVAEWPDATTSTPESPTLITEGVKDAAALHGLGYLAPIGLPGSELAAKFARVFSGCHVVIVPDRDVPGEEAARYSAARLSGVAASVRIATLPGELKETHGDGVREILAMKDGERLLRQAILDSVPWVPGEHPEYKDDPEVNELPNDPHRLARIFITENQYEGLPTIRFWRGVFYRWHDGYYDSLDAEEIRCLVVDCMKREFDRINIEQLKKWKPEGDDDKPPQAIPVTVASVGSVMQALRSLCVLSSLIESPSLLGEDGTHSPSKHLISLSNGVLNLTDFLADSDDVLMPHSPSLFTLAALPVAFDPSADCPLWRAFLTRNLADDDRCDMLQEWFGVCSTFNNSFQSFLMMEGSGSNGKSVICSVLTAFLGLRNVSHVPLECFGETFHLSGTVGKLANIVSEIGEVEKANEGTLKSYTSGDRMTFNRKNLPLFEAVPTARLVMATNALPRFADRSNGVWRRMLLLPLTTVIDATERVAGMDSAEWWASRPVELSGILLWALTGLARLMKPPHKFTEPAASLVAKEEYKKDLFIARRFLEETYEADPNGEVSTIEMYKLYQKWCDDHGNKPQACNSFAKEIKQVFPSSQIKRWVIRHDGTKGPGYTGFEIRETPSLEQQAEENKKTSVLF